MSVSKFRIPRVAAAALVFGGACGDDDGGSSTSGVDVSSARVERLAKAYCKQYAECAPDYFSDYYDTQSECVKAQTDSFPDYVETYGKECADAYLDWMDCATKLDCKTDDPDVDCARFDDAIEKACPDEDESAGGGESFRSLRSLRIPR